MVRNEGNATGPAAPSHRDNNFDTLRIVGAFAVLFAHSFALTAGTDVTEPMFRLSRVACPPRSGPPML